MENQCIGRVKWFNDLKGYGFITWETGADLFVHYADIQAEGFRTLREDEMVAFELVQGDRGLKAANVVKI